MLYFFLSLTFPCRRLSLSLFRLRVSISHSVHWSQKAAKVEQVEKARG